MHRSVKALMLTLSFSTVLATSLPAQAETLRERIAERRAANSNTADSTAPKEYAYGTDSKQKLDVYRPSGAKNAPIIIMVHGGAWKIGDKTNPGVADVKAEYWGAKGYIVVSVNYRLLPAANPDVQAEDVARAIAYVQKNASSFGGNANEIVLMGHSAGAHLVALLSADPRLPASVGARPWKGTVVLDSAALNVPLIMKAPHKSFYDDAFGTNPTYWTKTSPVDQLTRATKPLYLVCSTQRADNPCAQATGFAARAKALGVKTTIDRQDLSHEEINKTLGLPSAYTEAVDAFIRSVLK